ncbi:MAG: amino acid adenylation domain-containing protein [Gammaproteobacteria bacterium]|nr:amino acid adenylation domain-containing protein [Gammaproteobacteria bacterium]
MTDLQQRLEQLSPAQRELVLKKLKARQPGGDPKAADAAFPKVRRDGPPPVSFAQRRLWFLDQLEGPNAIYNMRAALRLRGALDLSALQRSLDEIVRRHEVLRTHFAEHAGQPVQVILPAGPAPLPLIDLLHLPASEAEQSLQRLLRNEPQRPFDLSQGPLLRLSLVRLNPRHHVLLSVMHHIVSDGWSLGLFIQELSALYAAFSRGDGSPLAEPDIQYADFAAWQRDWLSGPRLDAQLTYWKNQLSPLPAVLALPTDHPRPPIQRFRGAEERFTVDRSLTRRLRELTRQAEASPFMTLLAAFAVLLARYSGQRDIVIGSPISNRGRRETETLIGFFVNTLALRIDLTGEPSFQTLLGRVRRVALDAYTHQDLPFEKLVEELQPERDPSRSPLFQVAFSHQQASSARLDLPGLEVSSLELERFAAIFDLTLIVEEGEQELSGIIEYSTDLFDAETIRRLARHYCNLLSAVVADPQRRIATLPLLDSAERQQLLKQWNDTARPYPITDIARHFAERARLTPAACALIDGDRWLSYGELEQAANRVAHFLRRQGVGRETRVALRMERRATLVTHMLAVLKAGGAYLPVDADAPPERVRAILADSGAVALLTQAALADSVPVDDICRCWTLEAIAPALSTESDEAPTAVNQVDDLAYVIYTSGSTGQPKGVAVTHRAVLRLVCGTDYVAIDSTDVVAQASSMAFDAATFEIWGALSNGAQVAIAPREVTLNPAEFADWLRDRGVTILFITTALFNQMARTVPQAFRGLRHLLFGGEAVDPRWVRRVLASGPPERLLHVYGPTENTTFSTWHPVRTLADDALTVPIGRPIANTSCYVLDADRQPAPVGVTGELYLGGAGLARGYLRRPALTAERFVPDPFASEPGARLYRTGDQVRYRPDGSIEFLGRTDFQVKIRGFRVEPGEVESALLAHPQVAQALVLARPDAVGAQQLIAYVVPQGDRSIDSAEWRHYLATLLPKYMMPAAFVSLPEFPLNANAKIDRNALPGPDEAEVASTEHPPRTPTEEVLVAVWSDVLAVKSLGIHDDFFDRGGHSLLATQIVSRLRDIFGIECPLRAFFSRSSVAELARYIDDHRQLPAAPSNPVKAVARNRPLPLSFAQERLWFLDQIEGASAAYNVPAAIRLRGPLQVRALERSVNELIRRHEVLRTHFVALEGQPVQRISPVLTLPLPVLDLREIPPAMQNAEIERLTAESATRPFALDRGPLLRMRLLQRSADEYVLLSCLHHIIADGWSLGVFMRELSALYAGFAQGVAPTLPELTIQYADYAVWQRDWLQGPEMGRLLDYWRSRLAGAPPVLELPTDHGRPAMQAYRGRVHAFSVDRNRVADLRRLGRRSGCTLFMTLLAAYAALLSRYSGQSDVVIGSPIANRNRSEIEPLIGFFVNTLALRVNLADNPTFATLLERVRTTTLDAYAHQDMPFEKLVDALQPERSLSYTPLFQVMFILQNAPVQPLTLPDLTLTPLPSETRTAKYDLTLALEEAGDELSGHWEYNSDLFEAATIERWTGHFLTLLERFVSDSGRRVAEIPFLGDRERQRLLFEWNDTARSYRRDVCLHAFFEAQAAATPEAVALIHQDQRLSYRQLNDWANALAKRLIQAGVGSESRIGVCVERSPILVAALLASLKAGGAYVPLDPQYPRERLALMLDDAQATVLLTERRLQALLPEHGGKVIWLDEAVDTDPGAVANPEVGVTPRHLAYVLYTSGSTGRPKGVAIEHGSAAELVQWAREVFSPEELAGVLASTSICFDLSVYELFVPLSWGGAVILAENALSLPDLPARESVTLVNTVPSAIAALLRDRAIPAGVITINLAGEPLKGALIEDLYRQTPVRRVFNLYGPSEDTTYSTGTVLPRNALLQPSIGRPIADTQVYILDARQQPAPIGVPGELHIGGAGLARGYFRRPALTAEKFIPNPFGETPGARLYNTGDLARYRADGEIEFLGRRDHQIKLRGFRIELGEIEALLARHPAVRDNAVAVHEDSVTGAKRLMAYVVPTDERRPRNVSDELREFLSRKLPDFMAPSLFMILDAMPLTPNGKLDRRALPRPDRIDSPEAGPAPRNAAEKILADIWAKLLQRESIGIYDNFFDLGGDSIISIQVVARAKQAGLRITPKQLFTQQTVAALAAVADATPGTLAEQGPVTGRAPLSPIQQWFFGQRLPQPQHFNHTVLLETPGGFDASLLERTLGHLARHHDMLRARFTLESGYWRQHLKDDDPVARPVAQTFDLAALSADKQVSALEATAGDLQASLDLAEGPLYRVVLFHLGEGRPGRLLLIVHHLLIDGVSWRILLEDLQTVYRQLEEGQAPNLPPKTTSFKRWAEYLVKWADSDRLAAEAAYWLAAVPPNLPPLPLDEVDGKTANTTASQETVSMTLDGAQTRALLYEVPAAYNTQINDALLTALTRAVSEWTGQRGLLVNLEGHGREAPFDQEEDVSRTVGWFTSLFPVYLPLDTDSEPGADLRAVKERLRRLPNQGIGYGLLRYMTADAKYRTALRALPLPEISFNYLGQFDPDLGGWLTPAREPTGPSMAPQNPRYHLLDVSASVFEGRLTVHWFYSTRCHRRSTIERLAEGFKKSLLDLIAHCQSPQAGGYTPSDFPDVELSQENLDRILDAVDLDGLDLPPA